MIQQQVRSRPFTYGQSARLQSVTRTVPSSRSLVSPSAAGVAVVEAAIGYEWLISGLNKLLSSDFSSGLAHQLQTNLQGNPNSWYVSLANKVFIPNARLFAALASVGEILVALGMFAGALFWVGARFPLGRFARRLNLGIIGALLGGVLMSANYAVLAGNTLPGINPANAFNEGISIDSLLTIVGLGLVVIHVAASRTGGKVAAEA